MNVMLAFPFALRYGVPERYIFQEEDILQFKNVPKVTRCVAMLAKMVTKILLRTSALTHRLMPFLQSGAKAFEDLDIQIPENENEVYLDSDDE